MGWTCNEALRATAPSVVCLAFASCGPEPGEVDAPDTTSTSAVSTDSGVDTAAEVGPSTTAPETSSDEASPGDSSTGSDDEPPPDPPPLIWIRQYSLDAPGGLNALRVSDDDAVTIAGGVFESLTSIVPEDELDLVGPGSFILRYDDGGLAWSVVDGGRWNYLLEVLTDGTVLTVGSYDDDLGPPFAADSPAPIELPATEGEGLYVARYSDDGMLEWVLAASNGNPGALHTSIDPSGALAIMGYAQGLTDFQPEGATIEEAYFNARYTLDGQSMVVEPGSIPIDASPTKWSYQLWVDGPEFWPDGSSVFAGSYCGALVLSPEDANASIVSDPADCAAVDDPPTNDALLVRYAPDGSLDWFVAPSSPGYAGVTAPHVTASGRLALLGQTLDVLEWVDTHGTSVSIAEGAFVTVLEADGELVWTRRIGAGLGDSLVLDTTNDGGVVAVGVVSDTVVIEPDTEAERTFIGPGMYMVHYAADGTLERAAMLLEGQPTTWTLQTSVGGDAFAVSSGFNETAVLLPGGPDETMLTAEYADSFVALFEL